MPIALKAILMERLLVLLIGSVFVYLGYRLFVKGTPGSTGEVDVQAGGVRAHLINAAPGVFFMLAGAAIIVLGIVHNFSIASTHHSGTVMDDPLVPVVRDSFSTDSMLGLQQGLDTGKTSSRQRQHVDRGLKGEASPRSSRPKE